MRTLPPLVVGVLVVVALERLVELLLSRRNQRRLVAAGGVPLRRDGFGLLVAVHVLLYPALILEWGRAPWTGIGPWTLAFLAVAVLATALRAWAALTLGVRYTVRVVRSPGPLVARGPYRWVRHPIYAAVAVEVAAVPLAFAAFATALVLGALNVVALARRIRREERHLGLGPG